MHKKSLFSAFALCLISVPFCPSASQALAGKPTAHNDAWMDATRQAGRQADVQQVGRLTKGLKDGSYYASDPDAVATMLALSQIGSADALPAINTFLEQEQKKTEPNTDAVNAALVARARIIAQQSAETIPGGLVLRRFYAALSQTPEQINADIAAYVKACAVPASDLRVDPPLGVYAVRTVADMAYRRGDIDLVQSPEAVALNFAADPRSALKMQLAPLSAPERAAWLVETLSNSKVRSTQEYYEIQLAGELGRIVEPLAAAKVQAMSLDRQKYRVAAFSSLFGVLYLSGEAGAVAVKPYLHDKDADIADAAQHGAGGTFTVGY